MSEITKPILLNETGEAIKASLDNIVDAIKANNVVSELFEIITVSVSYNVFITERADYITVTVDGSETQKITLKNNTTALLSFMKGTKVKIAFQVLETAKEIADVEFETTFASRTVEVAYKEKQPTFLWVNSDGTTVDVEDYATYDTAEKKANIVGLYCDFIYSTDSSTGVVTKLSDLDSAFIIPAKYLVKTSAVPHDNWGSTVDFNCLTNRDGHSSAYLDYDGNTLTTKVLAECAERSVECKPATTCRNISFVINEVTLYCFFASYAQMYLLANNTSNISSITKKLFGVSCPSFDVSRWLTISEYSASNSNRVMDKALNTYSKGDSQNYIPLIPYSLS